jgi:hypothetical protein
MIVLGRGFGGNGTCSVGITCLVLQGATTYYGLIYDSDNADQSDVFRVGINGTAKVVGAVISDWQGGLYIDSTASPALTYDPNAFSALTTNGAPKILQGTFREVPPGS